MIRQKERVVVAMSGGVDSSVAAALLLKQGYQVIGMMMRLWSESGSEDNNRCCTPDAMAQARRVAAILGIPFYVIDAKQIFYDTVVSYFLEGYLKGQTPNPCLMCNRKVRWDYLLNHALDLEANYLATGHYVRVDGDAGQGYRLLRALDPTKDQSYVLHILSQDQLKHARFPIGDYSKSEIRKIALELKLPVAQRPDSQDLCFLGKEGYGDFLRRNKPESVNPGPMVNRKGDVLGEHQGLAFYTLGQRKGLGISSAKPLYVLEKDIGNNQLVVGELSELGDQELDAKQTHWVSGTPPEGKIRAQVKIRYKASPVWGWVTPGSDGRMHILFDEPVRDITPGQAAVIYDGDVCLGGGIIV